MYSLNNIEMQSMRNILQSPYMACAIRLVDKLKDSKNAFDEIYRILNESKSSVDDFLAERKKTGEIKDEKQALKSIAGNSFSKIIEYIFLKNKIIGNIRPDIFITSQKSKVPNFEEISTIKMGDETQKPDCDLVIYSLNKNNTLKKCMILSLKTSLRDNVKKIRNWKFLMEIATSEKTIKENFGINYTSKYTPLVCLAITDFYKINISKIKNKLIFFDKTFIADKINSNFIAKMSLLPNYVNDGL